MQTNENCKRPRRISEANQCRIIAFNDHPEQFFSGAKIELVTHKGRVGKDYVEKIFTGPIVKQIRNVLNFIKTNIIQEQVSKAPGQAEAVRFFNYPYEAIEEALVNAVYHRSYERENPVEIQIHSDKIEILSFPGPMPPVDKEMLKKERVITREYRNRKLGGFFKELKLSEGRGTGLPIIYNSLEINGSPPPVFETDDDRYYFLSVIKVHPLTQHVDTDGVEDVTKDATQDKELLINSLTDIDGYLRSFDDLRWTQVEKKIKSKVDSIYLKALLYCISPKTREEIFEHIEIYNNSRNFNNYIKPIIEIGWLQLTIPDKPTSKNQKYVTSNVAKRLVELPKTGIKRIPVASSNIASVGYDAEKQILEMEFHHGAIYQYFDVPKEVYDGLMSAGSIGSYFMHNIKNKYQYQNI